MTDTIQTINPATGETITTYYLMSEVEMDLVVENCYMAFLDWRKKVLEERAQIIQRIGEDRDETR